MGRGFDWRVGAEDWICKVDGAGDGACMGRCVSRQVLDTCSE